jgi:hypothetical protein
MKIDHQMRPYLQDCVKGFDLWRYTTIFPGMIVHAALHRGPFVLFVDLLDAHSQSFVIVFEKIISVHSFRVMQIMKNMLLILHRVSN